MVSKSVTETHRAGRPDRRASEADDAGRSGANTADRSALAIRAALDGLSAVLARAAAAFVRMRAWHIFGFARLDDHARERFGRSGRWLRDLAALGEGLSRSTSLAAALTGSDGRRPLGRVAATLIARAAGANRSNRAHPGAPLDVQDWIEAGRRLSVRDLRVAIREAASDAPDAEAYDDPDSDRVLVRLPVPLPILAAFDEAVDLHRAVEGRSTSVMAFVEALLGEASASGLPEESAGIVAALEPGTPEAQVEAALRRATSAWASLPPPLAAVACECESAAGDSPDPGAPDVGAADVSGPDVGLAAASLRRFQEIESAAGRGDAAELDRQIRALVAIENDLEARLGEMLATLAERRDWSRLQFAGVGHYAEERLGMSRSRAGERARLARALRSLPAVAAACASGRIAMEAAALIHRILGDADGDPALEADESAAFEADRFAALQAAWVEHAGAVTVKRMRDEARAAGRYRVRPRPSGRAAVDRQHPAAPFPLSDAAWHRSIRREAGTATRRILAFGRLAAGFDGPNAAAEPDVFHLRLHEPDVFLRLRLPADPAAGLIATIAAARDVVEARVGEVPWDRHWPPGPSEDTGAATTDASPPPSEWAARVAFVRGQRAPMWVGLLALLEDFAATWDTDVAAPERSDGRIFVRDGWRCAAPGCSSRRHLEDHHVVYRSRGGGDDATNRVSLCRFHHQRGEHGGLMQVRGRAPTSLTWRLGRADVAVAYRNERRRATCRFEPGP